ncbi:PREDICTED: putative GTP-binding protein 6 [Mandrillus leucophaeus]|uniref:putative GTP-binding protein 6 n=1 Tax=Mandrillus leucophaeus TaxID=9568 RepID=UPI0005F38C18|nr:PREDICTED: putative GTP-binding protein 6 [Mandrillus leucophaeus]
MVVSTKSPDRKLVFGKGNFQHLTEKIRGSRDITCVFLNVERMAAPTKKELEAAWGVEVFDRFTVVLHIFRCNARTREARLQVALAEIPLHRSNLKRDVAHLHRGAGSRYIMGSGESFLQVQQRLLREKEAKIRKALDRLRRKRHLLRQQRARREFPVVSVVGYTNCGEHPREDSPREGVPGVRVGCTRAMDLIVHVRDVSHPEAELQKRSVLSTLHSLQLPAPLLHSMVEVHNKVDLVPGGGSRDTGSGPGLYPVGSGLLGRTLISSGRPEAERGLWHPHPGRYSPTEPNAVPVSALLGHGLQELKAELDAAVLKATGRQILTLRVRLAGAQLRRFAALTARPDPQDLIVHVRDVSHPEAELQKRSVLSTLHSLQLPAPLLHSMVEVHNKVDLVPGYSPTEPNAVPVSALLGHGLQELKAELDAAVLKATGRQILTLRVRLAGAQLSWLYKEATVQDVDVIPEDGAADVTVIISDSAYGKFRKLFPG